jgi:ribonuclease Z
MLPERLAQRGISGPDVSRLQRQGSIEVAGRRTDLAEVSEARRGQRFAFVMDTRLCDNVFALAEAADLLVIESTFLARDARLAEQYGHLTAAQAGRVAAESGVRRLVLTHFSQRYDDPSAFGDEAAQRFDGDIVVASDLSRVGVPHRRS